MEKKMKKQLTAEQKLRKIVQSEIKAIMNEANYYGEVQDPLTFFSKLVGSLEELNKSYTSTPSTTNAHAKRLLDDVLNSVERAEILFKRWANKYGEDYKK